MTPDELAHMKAKADLMALGLDPDPAALDTIEHILCKLRHPTKAAHLIAYRAGRIPRRRQ